MRPLKYPGAVAVLGVIGIALILIFSALQTEYAPFLPHASSVAPSPDIMPDGKSAAIAQSPQSFQHLVSFTSRGFEPSVLTIKQGETVRFVNNTGNALEIFGDAPMRKQVIAPHQYLEVMFATSGAYTYTDTITKSSGVVRAE